jgi:hypothetical protein
MTSRSPKAKHCDLWSHGNRQGFMAMKKLTTNMAHVRSSPGPPHKAAIDQTGSYKLISISPHSSSISGFCTSSFTEPGVHEIAHLLFSSGAIKCSCSWGAFPNHLFTGGVGGIAAHVVHVHLSWAGGEFHWVLPRHALRQPCMVQASCSM